jgi:hypothetical protein
MSKTVTDMTDRELAEFIRSYVTGKGLEWNIIAAARLCANSQVILWKIAPYVGEDGWIWWHRLAEHVDVSGWSSGEKAIIRLACSLAGHAPADPADRHDGWLL